jgi:signal transduction histidine kinase
MSGGKASESVPGNTVLVVDDEGISRYMLSQYVRQIGHRVESVGSGREALAYLRAQRCDLVLLDVMMPEMDGHAVLGEMRADARLREVPAIMVSGLDEIQSVVRCIEQGAEDYLIKPLDPVLLRARINACLEKKQLRDQERRKTEELEHALAQLRRTQDQLVVNEKLASLGVLTAGIAHEIRNPLNFVTNFALLAVDLVGELRAELTLQLTGLVEGKRRTIEEILAHLEQNAVKIREHGRRADSIVASMLLHSRGQSGEWQPTDLSALAVQYVTLAYHGLRAQDPSLHIAIEADCDPALGLVNVVPQDICRVFLNIANNACYATYEKSKIAEPGFRPMIRVRTRDLGELAEVRVRDNGPGIPRDVRDRIFNPFFTTKPAGSGSGLGLSISYDIVVRQHGGQIAVESEEGEYTEFVITLPKDGGPAKDRS